MTQNCFELRQASGGGRAVGEGGGEETATVEEGLSGGLQRARLTVATRSERGRGRGHEKKVDVNLLAG